MFGGGADDEDKSLKDWQKEEAPAKSFKNEKQGENELVEVELDPRRRCLHKLFILFSVVSVLAALNMAVGQCLGIALKGVALGRVPPAEVFLRIYVVCGCVLVFMTEVEWTTFTRESKILMNWVTRGLFYAFIGVIGLEEDFVNPAEDPDLTVRKKEIYIFIQTVAYMMIGCGLLYSVMGMLCLQILCNRYRRDYKKRCENAKEAKRNGRTFILNKDMA